MVKSTKLFGRFLVRVAVTSALGFALVALTATPAFAEESGVITQYRGNLPDYGSCSDFGQRAQDRENADSYDCYKQANNSYDLYLSWYT
jgi:hypothetical protein